MKKIRWKAISGLEGFYEVSDSGLVRSVTRVINGRTYRARMMKGRCGRQGYLSVGLRKIGASATRIVHRLVAEAFLENSENLPEVLHLDGDKMNADYKNLVWASKSEVQQHNWERGVYDSANTIAGERVHFSKITDADAIAIRASSKTPSELAKIYPIQASAIGKIKRGQTWKHIGSVFREKT